MTAITFDTLKYAKRLKEAGFTESQAEGLAAAQAELIEGNLATKRDLKELEHRLVAKLYRALLIQTFALASILTAVVAALVKLL